MIRTLSCNCGAIRLETNAELGPVGLGNCTKCARAGMLGWKVDRETVRLATPRSGLSTYVWRFVDEGLHFCPTCGTTMCATGPDGYFVLNAGCIDGLDIHTLTIEKGDCLHTVLAGDVPPLTDESMDPAMKARIEELVFARYRAQAAEDWAKADAIRDALAELNVEVMDGPNGPQITILTA
jgi:hypothetical protein